jgi:small subunit ribosomal protein S1
VVEGEVKNVTEFGLFIGLEGDVDGMVHLSDLDWQRSGEEAIKDYKKGDRVKAAVLDVDREKERISLSVKQLQGDPMAAVQGMRKGATVTCEVTAVQDNGIEVRIAGTEATAFIRRGDLARERADQRPERFAVGEKVDAKITQIDKAGRKISVSIKALEIADEKAAVAQYGSTDSGASLGDILGAALSKARKSDDDESEGEDEGAGEEESASESGSATEDKSAGKAKSASKAKSTGKAKAADKDKAGGKDEAAGDDGSDEK